MTRLCPLQRPESRRRERRHDSRLDEYKQAVIDAIRDNSNDIKGITSPEGYTFDEYNNPIKPVVVIKLETGRKPLTVSNTARPCTGREYKSVCLVPLRDRTRQTSIRQTNPRAPRKG